MEEKVLISIQEYNKLREDSLALELLKRAFEQSARLGWGRDCVTIDSDEFFAVVKVIYPIEYGITLNRLKDEEKAAEEAKKSDEE